MRFRDRQMVEDLISSLVEGEGVYYLCEGMLRCSVVVRPFANALCGNAVDRGVRRDTILIIDMDRSQAAF